MTEEAQTEVEATAPPLPPEPEIQAPWLLYCVFGVPIFLTVLWFFLQFTKPDRFGRVDAAGLPDPREEGPGDSESPEPEAEAPQQDR